MYRVYFIWRDVYWLRLEGGVQELMGVKLCLSVRHISNYENLLVNWNPI
jgi:hypothetical protein